MADINQQGQFWDRVTERVQPLAEAQHLIESLIPVEKVRGRDVLDAGCGSGDFSAALARIGARSVTGFDVSTGSLRVARDQTPSARFEQASLSELPYPGAAFDVVWVWGVLHHVPDSAAALREIARVLRPGGIVVIHTLRSGFLSSLELFTVKVLSRAPRWVEALILDIGDRVVPLITRLLSGRRPDELTSKTVRQKLQERLFVPGDWHTFTFEQLAAGLGQSLEVSEAHPPIANLLKLDMSFTVVGRKRQ